MAGALSDTPAELTAVSAASLNVHVTKSSDIEIILYDFEEPPPPDPATFINCPDRYILGFFFSKHVYPHTEHMVVLLVV